MFKLVGEGKVCSICEVDMVLIDVDVKVESHMEQEGDCNWIETRVKITKLFKCLDCGNIEGVVV